jgi:hypothetical protein
MVERCDQWRDYSPRNQVLLASYGVVGPVAGTATWARVPSTEDGRPCAPRSGEHGLPIRVPVVAEGTTSSQRSRLPARSGSLAAGHRWDLVYAAEQLARRPARDALVPPAVPALKPGEWSQVVRRAEGRLIGRTPRTVDDPERHLTTMAARARRCPPDGQHWATRRWSPTWCGRSPRGSGSTRAPCRRTTRPGCRHGSAG